MDVLSTSAGKLLIGNSGNPIRTTVAQGDTTAPVLSSATGTATGSTTADGSVSTDEGDGTLYWVVTTSATSPSVAQVQAGQDHNGSAAADSGNQAVSATGTQNVSASGLSASTTYHFHFQQEDAATNDSSIVSSASFETDAAASLDQTAVFGAETRGGAGGYQITEDGAATGAAVTNVTDDGTGTATGYSLSAAGIITPSTDGSLSAQDGNTIDYTSDQGSGTVTFSIEANRADVSTAAEFGVAVTLYETTATAKKIAIRPSAAIGPWDDDWFDTTASNTGTITVTSSDITSLDSWGGFDFGGDTDIRLQGFGNLVFDRINWHVGYDRVDGGAGSQNGPRMMNQRAPVTWRRCKITGTPWTDLGPGEHRRGLISTTNFAMSGDITFENCLISDSRQGLNLTFPTSGNVGTLTIKNNTFQNIFIDPIKIGGVVETTVIEGNVIGSFFTDQNRPNFGSGATLTNGALTGAADDTQCLFFSAFSFMNAAGTETTFFKLAGITVTRLASGAIEVTALDTGAATAITLTGTSTPNRAQRGAILVSLDTNGTSRFWLWSEDANLGGAWTEEATATAGGETLDLTSDCTIGDGVDMDVTFERVAFWQGVAPDVSVESTRDDFLHRTAEANDEPLFWHGSARDASVSNTAHGTPIVDIRGYWRDVRDGVNEGSGGNFTRSGIIELPHGDGIQFIPKALISGITINGNIVVSGRFDRYQDTRFENNGYQGIFMEDVAPDNYDNVLITNNLVATNSSHAISLYNANNSRISSNTGVYIPSWKTADNFFPRVAINQQSGGTATGNTMRGNVADSVSSFEGTDTVTDNIEANADTTGTNAWSNLFDGDGGGGFVPTSVENFVVVFANKTGGPLETATPDIGAVHPGNDYDLATIWHARSPTFTDLYA